jgi:hypothetical protein
VSKWVGLHGYIFPRFRCELTTKLGAEEVEVCLRESISTSWWFHSWKYPFSGTFVAPEFEIQPNMEGEGSGTKITGVVICGEGVTKVQCSALLGMGGILLPLVGFGIILSGALHGFRFDQADRIAFSVLGTLALTSLLRWYQVHFFWKEADEMLRTLAYILRAEVVSFPRGSRRNC